MEDFVPFEIAKKLKEKGFREPCLGWYYPFEVCGFDYKTSIVFNNSAYRGSNYKDMLVSHKDEKYIDAPTISQVLKWLRDQEISVEPLSTPYNDWKCYIKNKGEIVTMISDDKNKTYEQAVIAGIEEVLDNLIENIMEKKRYVASGLSATSNDNLHEQLRQLQLYVP